MKNAEVWEQYQTYTKDITELCRKLGFAVAAICWVLKLPDGTLSTHVLWALGLIVLFFISDVLQSLAGAFVLRTWMYREEARQWNEGQSIDGEYQKPRWLDTPAYVLFFTKIFFLIAGFIFIGLEILFR